MPYRIITQLHRDAGTCIVEDGFDMYEDARQSQRQVYQDTEDYLYEIEYYHEEEKKESKVWVTASLWVIVIGGIISFVMFR